MKISIILTLIIILIELTGLQIAVAADDKEHVAEISLAILSKIEGRGKAVMMAKIYPNDRLIVDPAGLVRLRLLDSKEIDLFDGIHQLVTKIDATDKVQYLVLVSQQKKQNKLTEDTQILSGDKDKFSGTSVGSPGGNPLDETSDNAQSEQVSSANGDQEPGSNGEQKPPEESNNGSNDSQNEGTEEQGSSSPCQEGNCGGGFGSVADEALPPASDPTQHPGHEQTFSLIAKMTEKGFVTMPFARKISNINFNRDQFAGSEISNFTGMVKSPGLETASQPNGNKFTAIPTSTPTAKALLLKAAQRTPRQSPQSIVLQPGRQEIKQIIVPKLLLNDATLQNKVKAIHMK